MENKYAGGSVEGIAERPEGEPVIGPAPKTVILKQDEPKGLNFYDNRHIERSARVMEKFPPEEYSDLPDENEQKGGKTRQPENNGQVSDNNLIDLTKKTGQMQNDHLLFHGVVRDDSNKTLEGAIVMLFACYKGSREKPLGYCFSGSDGTYILDVPKPPELSSIDGFKVMAGIAYQTAEGAGLSVRGAETPDPPVYGREMNSGFYSFLRRIYSNPGKTLPELFGGL